MNSLMRRIDLITKGDIWKSICMEEIGRYSARGDSGGPVADCIYAKLVRRGYLGAVLSSVDESDCDHMKYLGDLVYEFGHVTNTADPKCLKLTKISAPRKFIGPNGIATNTAAGESKDGSQPAITIGESVNLKRNRGRQSGAFINITHICGKGFPTRSSVRRWNGFIGRSV